jgi:hypothetical protein
MANQPHLKPQKTLVPKPDSLALVEGRKAICIRIAVIPNQKTSHNILASL